MATYTSNTFGVTVTGAEGVTGPITPDGQVTIAYDGVNGFGATGPTVVVFDDSSGGSHQTEVGLTDAVVGAWSGHGHATVRNRYTNEYARSGALSQRVRDAAYYAGQTQYYSLLGVDFTATNEVFISYCLRTPDYWPGNNGDGDPGDSPNPDTHTVGSFHSGSDFKFNWLSDGGYFSADGRTDICLPTKTGNVAGGSPILQIAGNDGNIQYDAAASDGRITRSVGFDAAEQWFDTFNGWTRFTSWLRAGADADVDAGDQFHQAVCPTLSANRRIDSSVYPVFNGSNSETVSHIRFPGWMRDRDTANLSHDDCRPLYDDIYVATGAGAAARVEIGDNAAYDSCTDLALATNYTWSNTSITCTLRSGAFANFSGKYIHIHDKDNNYVGTSRLIS